MSGGFLSQSSGSFHRGVLSRLVMLALAVLLAGQLIVAWFAIRGFEVQLTPELSQKAQAVGSSLAGQLEFAVVDLGIAPDDLVGVESLMDGVLQGNPDIAYLAVMDAEANPLFVRGSVGGLLDELAKKTGRHPEIQSSLEGLRGAGQGEFISATFGDYVDNAFPIRGEGPLRASLHVGFFTNVARERLSEVLLEIFTVIAVSWLVALEAVVYFMTVRVATPLRQLEQALRNGAAGRFNNRIALKARDEVGHAIGRFNAVLRHLWYRAADFRTETREIRDAQIDDSIVQRIDTTERHAFQRLNMKAKEDVRPRSAMQVRAPLFLFIFSEELSRSFLPLFIARFGSSNSVIPQDLLISLPITLFMLAAAVVTPFGASLADRFGSRRVFLAGVVPVLVGYIGTFFAQGYYDLVLWRVLTGIGYGMIFISSQAWITFHADEKNRAQSMAVFVGAVFAGTVCGPSIGGILADRIGFASTFLVAAGLTAVSGLLVYNILDNAKDPRSSTRSRITVHDWMEILKDRQFLSVTLFAALPGKLILAGFLFYLVPLYLAEVGNRQTVIGWIIMLYGLCTIFWTPLASRWADRTGRHVQAVAVGSLLAGAGCLVSLNTSGWINPTEAVVVAVVALGMSHGLTLTSQLAIIQEVADRLSGKVGRTSVIGIFRLLERGGTMLGPVIAAAFAVSFGYQGAIVGVGALVLAMALFYLVGAGAPIRRRERGTQT